MRLEGAKVPLIKGAKLKSIKGAKISSMNQFNESLVPCMGMEFNSAKETFFFSCDVLPFGFLYISLAGLIPTTIFFFGGWDGVWDCMHRRVIGGEGEQPSNTKHVRYLTIWEPRHSIFKLNGIIKTTSRGSSPRSV